MSIQEVEKAIQDTEIALSANPTGRTKELLLIGLQAFQDILLAEQLKKNEVQPLEKSEQLPTKREMGEWQKKAEKEIQQTHEEIKNMQGDEKAEYLGKKLINQYANMVEREQRVIAAINTAPVISIPVVEITLTSSTKQLNRGDIMAMLKTYFKRVATSKAMEAGRFSDAYGGSMGQDTYKLFQGWNAIYQETQEGTAWPPLVDVFPGWGRASQGQRVNAEILWRWATNEKG